jgi:phage terminase small subunit
MKLNPKQKRFCEEYIIDLNATQAAIRAGYSAHTAQEQSSRLLSNVMIKSMVEQLMEARGQRTRITADRVLQEIEHLASFDPAQLADVKGAEDIKRLPEDVRRAIVGWRYTKDGFEIKLAKEKALEMLGRHHKLFTDKTEHSGSFTLEELVAGAEDDAPG